jgi:hypothetical protein
MAESGRALIKGLAETLMSASSRSSAWVICAALMVSSWAGNQSAR